MKTTFDLDDASYRKVKTVAHRSGVAFEELLNQAVRTYFKHEEEPKVEFMINEAGWPTITVGFPITPEDVANALDDE